MKFGLALGGGGAKGFAHLGVLKVLDELGFKPDVISGTSAGALVGALYSNGHSPLEIFSLKNDFDFMKVMRFDFQLDGLSSLNGFRTALKRHLDGLTFKDLKIKFLAVATNLRTGKETVFSEGNVIDAVCASCSAPGVFNPTRIGNELFIDGSITSPVPVNALKDFGAEKILSVGLEHLKPELGRLGLLNLMNRASQIMDDSLMRLQEINSALALRIPTYNYLTISTNKAKELFDLGEKVARKAIPEIKKLLK